MSTLSKSLKAAAGNAGGDAKNVEDVFSTYLYDGTGAAQTITNGIDLAGEGGMVWTKARQTASVNHAISDTERGIGARLTPNDNTAEYNSAGYITSFNSDGWSMGGNTETNLLNEPFASWTFRKAPRFFDVVTWTGNGVSGREIAHNLGVAPGMIIVKNLGLGTNWYVYHRGVDATAPEDYYLWLDTYSARTISGHPWNNTAPTDTVFTVTDDGSANNASYDYVAYLFAHDPVGENNDGMIACGSYTGTTSSVDIDLGWEPQYLLIKKNNGAEDWAIVDNMRGLVSNLSGPGQRQLLANTYGTDETPGYSPITPSATGFTAHTGYDALLCSNAGQYIYMAIRAPMMKEPEAGTEVFSVDNSNSSDIPAWTSGFPVDMVIEANTTGGNKKIHSRLTGARALETDVIGAEVARISAEFDYSDGFYSAVRSSTQYAHMFKRAKGFFDVVAYTGNGTAGHTVNHSLSVAPEMMWVRPRSFADHWNVYHTANDNTKNMRLNTNDASFTNTNSWSSTTPDASSFTIGGDFGVNGSGYPYIAYLFASLAGVSKVGSYTGNGSNQDISCGFSGGARFVLIKRTDSTGDWFTWDTTRGIVAGNDPHLALNTTAQAEVTTDDSIDPLSAGFTVNQVAATNINVTNGTYIFLAIA